MTLLGRPGTPQTAFQLLVDLGLWSPHENLFLRRSQIPIQFPTKVLEGAAAIGFLLLTQTQIA
jgi:exoribonuclease-2